MSMQALDELIEALAAADQGHKAINSQNGSYYLGLAKQVRSALAQKPVGTMTQGEKRLHAHMKVEDWRKKHNILFINRSYGQETSNTVSLNALIDLASN